MFRPILRYVALLCVVAWVGGLLFFGAVLAPVAFHVLPSTHEAGLVVGAALRVLHTIGLACGLLLLMSLASLATAGRNRALTASLTLTAAMMALTAFSQFWILPRMDAHRATAAAAFTSPANPDRIAFDHLHSLSTNVEGAVLVAGLVLLALINITFQSSLAHRV